MRRLLASCFGLGWLPVAPGTWGSLPPTIVFVLMCRNSIPPMLTSIAMAALALAGSVICIKFAPVVVAAAGKTDPREVVVDEFAGQAIAFLAISFSTPRSALQSQIWAIALLGFVVFRLLDIAKPWPIRKLEKLPKGWGILADDLLAGAYAGIVLLFCLRIGLAEYLTESFSFDSGSLNTFKAAILGAAQGLTEFLPVSSSGHLVLFEKFFGFNPEEPGMLLFDLATHVGTVVAIFIVFRKSIAAFFKNLSISAKYGASAIDIYKKSPSVHLLVLAIVATVVTAVLGILFKDYFVSARGNLTIVGSMWIITGTLLLITDWRKKTRLGLRRFGILAAILVGLAQAAAIMPGISRSGATICTAILIGLHRRWAVEFSFLIAIPAILGATAVQLGRDFGEIGSATLAVSSVLAGSAAAALVGILALRLLIKTSRTANLKFFAFYCYILAAFVLFFY
jgi:undecaprenyl-diphosphatase